MALLRPCTPASAAARLACQACAQSICKCGTARIRGHLLGQSGSASQSRRGPCLGPPHGPQQTQWGRPRHCDWRYFPEAGYAQESGLTCSTPPRSNSSTRCKHALARTRWQPCSALSWSCGRAEVSLDGRSAYDCISRRDFLQTAGGRASARPLCPAFLRAPVHVQLVGRFRGASGRCVRVRGVDKRIRLRQPHARWDSTTWERGGRWTRSLGQ